GVRQSLRGPVGIFAVSHHHAALASSGAHHRQRPCIPTFRGRRSSYRTPRTDVDRSSDECPPACPRRYRSEEASALWLGTACRLYGSRTLCRQRYQPPARAVRIDLLAINTHKVLAAAGYDVRLDAIAAQILHEFEHRLIDEFGVGSLPALVLCVRQPFLYFRLEVVHRHAGQRGEENFFKVM